MTGNTSSTIIILPLEARVPMACILSFVIVFGWIGNMLVCLSIYRKKELRSLTNWFILSMSVADLGVIIFCTPFSLGTYISGHWPFTNPAACQFNGFMNSSLFLATILTLMMVSLHQYFGVCRRWGHGKLRRAAIIMIIYAWVHPAFISLLPLVGVTQYNIKEGRAQCSVRIPETSVDRIVAIIYITSGFVIPLIIICVSYSKIFHRIRMHTQRMKKSGTVDRKSMQHRLALTLVIVLVVFLFCWTPFLIMSLFGAFTPALSSHHLGNFAFLLGYANSACNPVVLGIRNPLFRNEFKRILRCVFCLGNPTVPSDVSMAKERSQSAYSTFNSKALNSPAVPRSNEVAPSHKL